MGTSQAYSKTMKTINSINKYRIRANRLRKSTKQNLDENPSGELVKQIVQRFVKVGGLKSEKESVQLRRLRSFPLNKYLDLIAHEEGHGDWSALSQLLREQDKSLDGSEDTELYNIGVSEFNLNVWCPGYEDAKVYLDSHRGFYLLQYKGILHRPHMFWV
jgi:hypothetical protein